MRLASVRRSLFATEADRAAFLTRLIQSSAQILRGRIGLTEHHNYHGAPACGPLARITAPWCRSRRPPATRDPRERCAARAEFCRFLGRLKTNYQLSELVGVEGYSEWIQLLAEFTASSQQLTAPPARVRR